MCRVDFRRRSFRTVSFSPLCRSIKNRKGIILSLVATCTNHRKIKKSFPSGSTVIVYSSIPPDFKYGWCGLWIIISIFPVYPSSSYNELFRVQCEATSASASRKTKFQMKNNSEWRTMIIGVITGTPGFCSKGFRRKNSDTLCAETFQKIKNCF